MIVVVEIANLIWAVDRTRTRPDTPVVDLCVEPVLVMICRTDRAHCLARCSVTVLAQHWNKPKLDVRILALPIALDPQPLHLSALGHSTLADDWDVIFGLAGRNTGPATGTPIEIDGHRPGVIELFVIPGFAILLPTCEEIVDQAHEFTTVTGIPLSPALSAVLGLASTV